MHACTHGCIWSNPRTDDEQWFRLQVHRPCDRLRSLCMEVRQHLSHTHTHTRTRTHTHTHTHTQASTCHTYTHNTYTHTPHTYIHTYCRAHTHTHTHTNDHKETHIQNSVTPSVSLPSLSFWFLSIFSLGVLLIVNQVPKYLQEGPPSDIVVK